jgi:hypothetical protein
LFSIKEFFSQLENRIKVKNMTEELIKNQNKLMQFQCIQVLSDSNKDVDAWYNQMKAWITFYQVTDEKEIFNNCKFKVIGK